MSIQGQSVLQNSLLPDEMSVTNKAQQREIKKGIVSCSGVRT